MQNVKEDPHTKTILSTRRHSCWGHRVVELVVVEMTILAQILCRRHNQSWVHLTGLRPPRQPHLVRQQRHCGHRTHQPFRSDPHRSKRDSYWDLLNLFIQEKGTRQPNTSSRNVTGKEIKNLSKFFVRNLNLKIKPKHLRGADRNLKLKCTAEERFIQDRKVVIFVLQVLDLYWRSVEVSLTVVRPPPATTWYSPAFSISASASRTLATISLTTLISSWAGQARYQF